MAGMEDVLTELAQLMPRKMVKHLTMSAHPCSILCGFPVMTQSTSGYIVATMMADSPQMSKSDK